MNNELEQKVKVFLTYCAINSSFYVSTKTVCTFITHFVNACKDTFAHITHVFFNLRISQVVVHV